jgi:4-amino-4-deoxy-L-arabinose transferase-like glycosyltransferase
MRSKILFLIFIGITIGMGVILFPLLSFVLFLIALGVIAIWLKTSGPERKFIILVFIVAISMRLFLCISHQFVASFLGNDVDLIGDARCYTLSGLYIAKVLSNHTLSFPANSQISAFLETTSNSFSNSVPSLPTYPYSILVYLYGVMFSAFNYSPLAVKFLNSFLFVISGICFYSIAKKVFNESVARLSLFFILFYPSLIIWSITGLKESLILFLISFIIWLMLKFKENRRILYVVLIILSSITLYSIRPFLLMPIIFTVIGYFTFSGVKVYKKIAVFALLIITLLFAAHIFKYNFKQIKDLPRKIIFSAILVQKTNYFYGGSAYKLYEDKFYNESFSIDDVNSIRTVSFVFSFLKGIAYFMFSPFPWALSSVMQLMVFPQVLFEYFLVPFAILGILVSFRNKFSQVSGILFFMLTTISILCLLEANIGTAFRHRDMIMPIYLIFSSAGIIKLRNYLKNPSIIT